MAFYTFSFPNKLSDDSCYAVWNIVLTRIRKFNPKFNYLWVSERQKNSTIHYHLLTNNFINVRLINHFAKKAITTHIYKNQEKNVAWSPEKYNGVDVKKVYNPRAVGKYISKYVTKNDITAEHCVWNCSRTVSSLMTSYRTDIDISYALQYFAKKLFTTEIEMFPGEPTCKIITYGFVHDPPRDLLQPLDELNEILYSESLLSF